MTVVSVPNDLANGANNDADQVDANFSALVSHINTNVIDKDGSIAFTGIPGGLFPSGVMQMYGGAAAPTGWLLCQGQAVSRATYSTLFGVIATTYGSGDGSTTFNVPDLMGRAAIGSGTGSGLTARTLGTKLGVETHALSAGELASHTHSFSATTSTDGSHTHTPNGADDTSVFARSSGSIEASSAAPPTGTRSTYTPLSSAGSHTHTLSGTSGSAGSGTAHQNMQPSTVINYIIKT